MARVKKRHSERKNEILDVSRNLFYQRGYSNTSVSEIIEFIGIAKGTFYHYFKSKDDLLIQIIQRDLMVRKNYILEIINKKNLNAIHKLNLVFSLGFDYRIANKESEKMLLQVFYHNDNNIIFMHKRNSEFVSKIAPLIADILIQGNEEKHFSIPEPLYASKILLCMGFEVDKEFARLISPSPPDSHQKNELIKYCEAYNRAFHQILELPEGTIKIVDIDKIDLFYSL